MDIQYDGTLDLAIGLKLNSKNWKNTKMTWAKLVEKLSHPVVTSESYAQFIKAPKAEQGSIKDVGGYVSGFLTNGQRTKSSVLYKQFLTLDIDFSYADFWWDFTMLFGCAAVIHSTHKSTPNKPRHRLIIPLSREVTAEEYEPIARYIANSLNIDLFDQTTYEVNRFMFWPSVSNDIEYYFEFQDGPWLDADAILATYANWHDVDEWPRATSQDESFKLSLKKQEDPTNKRGLVGAFCKAYTIQEAIAEFLSDVYEDVGDGRYTYKNGTTAAGLVTYEDKFAYSHHSTDPAGGRLCNAFDLVRIHLYGNLDDNKKEQNKEEKSRASFKSMETLCSNDAKVKRTIAKEKYAEAKSDFANAEDMPDDPDMDWASNLKTDRNGNYESTAKNISTILENDIILKDLLSFNAFDHTINVSRKPHWRSSINETYPSMIHSIDYAGIKEYIEDVYGISSPQKVEDAIALEAERTAFHPVRDYVLSCKWDGVKRIDTLLIDYFGADNTHYTKMAIRKSLCAAIARIFNPGVKYDMVLIIIGPQGTYKSTFLRKLGVNWFSDSVSTMQQSRESVEQLQGNWIIELAELSAFKKSESESIKQFLSKCSDKCRMAYARTVEEFKRQCIFFGTTNDTEFLKDPTGNRRFNPVMVHTDKIKKSVADDLTEDEVHQIWAEAYQLYKDGETLYFDKETAQAAVISQEQHSTKDELAGVIENYLNKLLPDDWENMDLDERRNFLEDPLSKKGTVLRMAVSTAEIWCECLGKSKADMNSYNTRYVINAMRALKEWENNGKTKRLKLYGKQRVFERKTDNEIW